MFENDVKILTEKSVVSEERFKNLFPDTYRRVYEYSKLRGALSWNEMKYMYMNKIEERPVCKICGKPVKFGSVRKGYTDTCDRSCDKLYKAEVQKRLWGGYTEEEKQARLDHAASVVEEKTGYRTPFANPEIRKRIDETMLKRYGTTRYISEEGRQTIKEYHKEHREELDNKIINTWAEKTGEEKININLKRNNACLDKFGVENYSKTESFSKFMSDKSKVLWSNPEWRNKLQKSLLDKYGVLYGCLIDKVQASNGKTISKRNKDFVEVLESANVKDVVLEFGLGRYSFDVKAGKYLIEIDPTYTHNSTIGPSFHGKKLPAKSIDYHINKTMFANACGYTCIHIWDWDSWDKVIYLVSDKENIREEVFDLIPVEESIAKEFLESFDIEGDCVDYQISLGLYEGDSLVQLAVFKQLSYGKYELLRICTRPDYNILGGSKRLFTTFIEQYKPISIIAISDTSKYNGSKYTELGMEFSSQSNPRKHWYNMKTEQHYLDNNEINSEILTKEGFVEVYDCGQSTYIWEQMK